MGLIAGLAVALVAVFLVLEPVLRPSAVSPFGRSTFDDEDDDPALVRRDTALAALKEIEFDQATGKLSDDDYERLRAKYTTEALEALRQADAAPAGGNGDAVEALIASAKASSKSKGRRFCVECGSVLEGSGRFCVECGTRVAA
ncbi:MAG: hypothetical protein Q7J79_10110 [Gemmatimonadales bacterium]|nr:hypothetical protein [Gemmatimonadales bacterium]